MSIENLYISFNSTPLIEGINITSVGGWYQEYTFTFIDAEIEWGGDKSNGYFYIHGGTDITFTFDTQRTIDGEVIATASGTIEFETDEGLNISWTTNTIGNRSFTILGGGVLTLSGFSFWIISF